MNKPRKPGSQVAPGLKPLHTDRPTASKHSKIPIAQATEGKLYRVRDKDWVALWGENLSWADAVALQGLVVSRKLSRTARAEDMAVAPPEGVEVPPITALELGARARAKHHPTRDTTVRPAATRTAPAPRDATVPGYRQINLPPSVGVPFGPAPGIDAPVPNINVNSMLMDPSNNPRGVVSGEINLNSPAADTDDAMIKALQLSPRAKVRYPLIHQAPLAVSLLPRFQAESSQGEFRIQTDGIITSVPVDGQLMIKATGLPDGGWLPLEVPALVVLGDVVMVVPKTGAWPHGKAGPTPADLREMYADLGTVTEEDLENAEADHDDSPAP
jgi:hypothetical protein